MLQLTYTGQYYPALPGNHRFPIAKYALVREQLLYEGLVQPEQLLDPGLCPEAHIVRVHTPEYWQAAKALALPPKAVRELGLPLVPETVLRAQNSVHCTLISAGHALKDGIGIHLGGGTHHAFADRPEGFCLLNDLAVAAAWLLHQAPRRRVLILDLDVHQGNGTASIFQQEPRVFTFSMHCQHNYPLRKEVSDRDVALASGTGDKAYLQLLEEELQHVVSQFRPDIMLYQAGVDVLAGDKLGRLSLSKAACQQRDRLVLRYCRNNSLPLVVTLGGGYHSSLPELIDAHCNTVREAFSVFGY
ncbi:deacetylase [Flammeovirgaceae bacterium 311]|nr:deacetylase [Flammeovirgaceae bacterium 311]